MASADVRDWWRTRSLADIEATGNALFVLALLHAWGYSFIWHAGDGAPGHMTVDGGVSVYLAPPDGLSALRDAFGRWRTAIAAELEAWVTQHYPDLAPGERLELLATSAW